MNICRNAFASTAEEHPNFGLATGMSSRMWWREVTVVCVYVCVCVCVCACACAVLCTVFATY